MCGILGAIKIEPDAHIKQDVFPSLLSKIAHRGPDNQGIDHSQDYVFAHARLSIIDVTDRSNQPMWDNSQTVLISYNGEIYNYKEVRKILVLQGHTFHTDSDTEVIINAYKEWGISFLNYINGMFAFALFDKTHQKYYLVRDRLGIKPLYYAIHEGVLLFCSEITGILGYPGFPKELNKEAIPSFLAYRYVLAPDTFFKKIKQLSPGFYLELSTSSCNLYEYWNIEKEVSFSKKSKDLSKIHRQIKGSIKEHLVSDVPLGIFLSGGIDSSIILSEAAAIHGNSLKSFTAAFKEKKYDESRYAESTAKKYNSEHFRIEINNINYKENIHFLIRKKCQPLGMHNEVAMYLLSKKVSKHVKVILCGEGADELFAGYGRIYRMPFDYLRISILKYFPVRLRLYILQNIGIKEGEENLNATELFLNRYYYLDMKTKDNFYTKSMNNIIKDSEFLQKSYDLFEKIPAKSLFDKISIFFIKNHLPGLLGMVDTTTMAAGVEARVPFLDHHLVVSAFDLKSSLKLAWVSFWQALLAFFFPISKFSENKDIPKYALKHLYMNKLSREILTRKKVGFPVPLAQWMGSFINELLHFKKSKIYEYDIFDKVKLQQWLEVNEHNHSDEFGKKIWLVLNLEIFLREYF